MKDTHGKVCFLSNVKLFLTGSICFHVNDISYISPIPNFEAFSAEFSLTELGVVQEERGHVPHKGVCPGRVIFDRIHDK